MEDTPAPVDAAFLLKMWEYLVWAYPTLEETPSGGYRSPWFTARTPFEIEGVKSRFCTLVGCTWHDLMITSRRDVREDPMGYVAYQLTHRGRALRPKKL